MSINSDKAMLAKSDDNSVICEKVTVARGEYDNNYLVQYTNDQAKERESAIAHLKYCKWVVTTQPHQTQVIGGEPCVTWNDLLDILEPRDD